MKRRKIQLKLSLRKVRIAKIQNSSKVFGGTDANPIEVSANHDMPQSHDFRISCYITQCATLGAGEVTDPVGNNNQVGTNNSQ